MRRDDSGFTLLEVVMATVLVGIVMTAMVTFFVSTTAVLAQQRDRQAAMQLADDAMELVRASGAALADGRVPGAAPVVAPGVDLSTTNQLNGTSGTVVLPLETDRGPIAGVSYQQYIYLGTCFEPATGGGTVTCTKATGDIEFYRVVVAVTWRDRHCPSGTCSAVVSTLVSCGMWTSTAPCSRNEPVFRVNP